MYTYIDNDNLKVKQSEKLAWDIWMVTLFLIFGQVLQSLTIKWNWYVHGQIVVHICQNIWKEHILFSFGFFSLGWPLRKRLCKHFFFDKGRFLLDSKVYIEKQLLIIYFYNSLHCDAPRVQKLCENLLREFGKCKLQSSYYTFYMFFNLKSHH
jgi:hypothetical protein